MDAETVASLTSNKWQIKEKALKQIILDINEYEHSPHFTPAFNYLLQICFDEKSMQISVQCCLLIQAILREKPDFQFEFLSQTLSYLCDKGAELGYKQHLCEETYSEFCKHAGLSLHDVIGLVATRESFYNKSTMNSQKQILFRV